MTKHLKLPVIRNMMDVKEALPQRLTNILMKKWKASGIKSPAVNTAAPNQQFADELHKPLISNLKNIQYIRLL